jgi:hypothetical protein
MRLGGGTGRRVERGMQIWPSSFRNMLRKIEEQSPENSAVARIEWSEIREPVARISRSPNPGYKFACRGSGCGQPSSPEGATVRPSTRWGGLLMRMIVQRWERSPETSVNILLFAGSRRSVFRLGLSRSEYGRRRRGRPHRMIGNSPCRGHAPAVARDFFHRTLPRRMAP